MEGHEDNALELLIEKVREAIEHTEDVQDLKDLIGLIDALESHSF